MPSISRACRQYFAPLGTGDAKQMEHMNNFAGYPVSINLIFLIER
jgi:hypothetical protein